MACSSPLYGQVRKWMGAGHGNRLVRQEWVLYLSFLYQTTLLFGTGWPGPESVHTAQISVPKELSA